MQMKRLHIVKLLIFVVVYLNVYCAVFKSRSFSLLGGCPAAAQLVGEPSGIRAVVCQKKRAVKAHSCPLAKKLKFDEPTNLVCCCSHAPTAIAK